MENENLNPQEEELQDDLNPNEEEETLSEDELDKELANLDDEDVDDSDVEDEDVLTYVLKHTNKKFTKEGLVKTLKQMDKDFAKKNTVKEQPQPEKETDTVISERLLKLEQPDSIHVIDMIKKDHPGKDVYEVWNNSEFYKREATIRAEKELARQRTLKPSGASGTEEEPSEEQKLEQKFMKNLPTGFGFKK